MTISFEPNRETKYESSNPRRTSLARHALGLLTALAGLFWAGFDAPSGLADEPAAVEKPADANPKPAGVRLKGGAVIRRPARAVPAPAVRVAVEAAVVEAADLPPDEALALQFKRQLRWILNAELYFLNQVCELTKEQRPAIKAEGEKVLVTMAEKLAVAQRDMQRGRGMASQLEPRGLIQKGLEQSLPGLLQKEQWDRYQAELVRRTDNRKRALVLLLVAKMDRVLLLNTEQREQLSEALLRNWQDSWLQSLRLWQSNEQYFPEIADRHLLPILNIRQQEIWRGQQKYGNVFFGDFGINVTEGMADAPWDDDEAAAAPADAVPEPKAVTKQAP